MDYKITGYEPAQLFHFFEEVSAIPRGSGNEKGISDFLVAFAKERGLDVYQDEVYNVIIRKPASAGAENAPTVMLQGHIDMVCDKLGSVEHDFTTDGIDLVVKDGVLTANGTTLGADNGIAVALMLTVLNDDSITHPALECVFTTDEETGLVGAETLDKSQISARTMINLDSEEEGVATVSCAGGVVVTYTCPIAREHKTGSTLTLDISGLLGGHSGSDINLERGNGNLIMARIIDRLMVAGEPAIVSFNGGTKDNAINRECKAVLVYADHAAAEAAAQIAKGIIADVTAELEVFEYPGWSYAEHSPVREVFVESYRELFGSELRIESIHAGLECGLFAEALHGLDAIAVGPTLSDVHTPDESMELASAERFYELLIDVLKRLAA